MKKETKASKLSKRFLAGGMLSYISFFVVAIAAGPAFHPFLVGLSWLSFGAMMGSLGFALQEIRIDKKIEEIRKKATELFEKQQSGQELSKKEKRTLNRFSEILDVKTQEAAQAIAQKTVFGKALDKSLIGFYVREPLKDKNNNLIKHDGSNPQDRNPADRRENFYLKSSDENKFLQDVVNVLGQLEKDFAKEKSNNFLSEDKKEFCRVIETGFKTTANIKDNKIANTALYVRDEHHAKELKSEILQYVEILQKEYNKRIETDPEIREYEDFKLQDEILAKKQQENKKASLLRDKTLNMGVENNSDREF